MGSFWIEKCTCPRRDPKSVPTTRDPSSEWFPGRALLREAMTDRRRETAKDWSFLLGVITVEEEEGFCLETGLVLSGRGLWEETSSFSSDPTFRVQWKLLCLLEVKSCEFPLAIERFSGLEKDRERECGYGCGNEQSSWCEFNFRVWSIW